MWIVLAFAGPPAHADLKQAMRVPVGTLIAGARSGKAEHQAMLGLRYLHGVGVKRDPRQAIRLFCTAARKGSGEGAFQVGAAHIRGGIVKRDTKKAAQWLGFAARKGHSQAKRMLAILPPSRSTALPGCPIGSGGGGGGFKARKPPTWAIQLAQDAGAVTGVDPAFILAVMAVESAYNPRAVSPKGARGLMQLMPGTATRFNVADPHDETQAVRGGSAYLAWLLNRFNGNIMLAAAAYNAGENAVDRYGGVPPYRETRDYIRKIASIYPPMAQALSQAPL